MYDTPVARPSLPTVTSRAIAFVISVSLPVASAGAMSTSGLEKFAFTCAAAVALAAVVARLRARAAACVMIESRAGMQVMFSLSRRLLDQQLVAARLRRRLEDAVGMVAQPFVGCRRGR